MPKLSKSIKISLILLFLVAFSAVILAQDENITESPFNVSIAAVKDKIDFEEYAQFKITIFNPRETIETFTIKPAGPYVEWFIKTDPASDYSVKVYPNTIKEVIVIVKPISVGIGRYALRLNINNEMEKELFTKDIIVNVVSMSNLPAVSISGKVPKTIDPREPFIVTVWLENRNSKQLDDVTVNLKSNIISESVKTTLGSAGSVNGTKTLEFSIKLDNRTAPIELDSLKVIVNVKDGNEYYEIKSAPYDYEVLRYGGLTDNHDPKFMFFGKYDEIAFVNDANTKYEGVARIENPFYRALFTKANPESFAFTESGKRYIGWNVDLSSQERFNVIVKVNYLPLIIFLIASILMILAYYSFRSPIIITKSAKDIMSRDGGIARFKIVLQVKNRSKKNIENISIIDKIPDIAEYEKEGHVGSLEPVKVVQTKKGLIAKWIISNLGSGEETVITYTIKSRLSVLGKMLLTVALSKFEDKKGNVKRSYSNKANIGL